MAWIRLSGQTSEVFNFQPLILDEFVPLVQLDIPSLKMGNVAHLSSDSGNIELSEKIDASLRIAKIASLTLSPGVTTIPFVVKKGLSTWDDNGTITCKLDGASKNVTISPNTSIPVSFNQVFDITITIPDNETTDFFLNFYANDNIEDTNVGEFKDIFCGRTNIKVFQDVFSCSEYTELVNEILLIKPFADAGTPAEYSGNYCMAAAERGLSKLLKNQSDFYSVDRSHSRLNTISFANKGAKDRGAKFTSSGFIQSSYTFKDYQIDHALRKRTKNFIDYQTNRYNVVTLNPGSELLLYFTKCTKDKNGYHVFYMSVSDDFHALLLVIDNSIVGNETYAIYDQHGKTSSFGPLSNIEAGFANQTSWTFLNFYGNRGFIPEVYGGVTTRIWKIQRKK